MKSTLIAYLFANGISAFQMMTYNEIHAELAEDCAFEIEATDSFEGPACRRYFDFRDSSDDLREMNGQWLANAELDPDEVTEALHFIERGNRAMRYIVQRSANLARRPASTTD